MKRNYLQGKNGDCINALLVGCGFNLRKLLRVFLWLIFGWPEQDLEFQSRARGVGLMSAQIRKSLYSGTTNYWPSS
jgi:IS5 family transposase